MPALMPTNMPPGQMLEANRQYAELLTGNRYNDVLEQRLAARDRLLGGIEDYGQGETARINQDYQNTLNSSIARLQNRGFAGSNLDFVNAMGAQGQRQVQLGQLNDRVIGMRTDLEQGLEEGIAQFQERRTDAGPTAAQAAMLGAKGGSPMFGQIGGGGGFLGGSSRLQDIWLQNQEALLGREHQLLAGAGNTMGLPTGMLGDRVRSRTEFINPFTGGRRQTTPGTRGVGQAPLTEQQQRDAARAAMGARNFDRGGSIDPNSLLLAMAQQSVQAGSGIGDPKYRAVQEANLRMALEGLDEAQPGFVATLPFTNMENISIRKGDPSIGGGFGMEHSRTPNDTGLRRMAALRGYQDDLLASGSYLRQSY